MFASLYHISFHETRKKLLMFLLSQETSVSLFACHLSPKAVDKKI